MSGVWPCLHAQIVRSVLVCRVADHTANCTADDLFTDRTVDVVSDYVTDCYTYGADRVTDLNADGSANYAAKRSPNLRIQSCS